MLLHYAAVFSFCTSEKQTDWLSEQFRTNIFSLDSYLSVLGEHVNSYTIYQEITRNKIWLEDILHCYTDKLCFS